MLTVHERDMASGLQAHIKVWLVGGGRGLQKQENEPKNPRLVIGVPSDKAGGTAKLTSTPFKL